MQPKTEGERERGVRGRERGRRERWEGRAGKGKAGVLGRIGKAL